MYNERNTIILLNTSYREFNKLSREEKIIYFINKFAEAIINFKDRYGLGKNIYNCSKDASVPKSIEDKNVIVINIDYDVEKMRYIVENTKSGTKLIHGKENNILKELWNKLFSFDKKLPEVFNYVEDILHNDCKMDNSKKILYYVCNYSLNLDNMFLDNRLEEVLDLSTSLEAVHG